MRNKKGTKMCKSPFCNFLANTILMVDGKPGGYYCFTHASLVVKQYKKVKTTLEPMPIPGGVKK